MRTINTVERRESAHRPYTANPAATFEISIPKSKTDEYPLTIVVTASWGDGIPGSLRRAHAEARTNAEDGALDDEDVIAQAAEANALDPVG